MDCKHFRESVILYIDGKLVQKEKVDIDEHLGACPECVRLLNEHLKTINFLKSCPGVEYEESLKQEVIANVIKNRVSGIKKTYTNFWVPISALAAVLLITVLYTSKNNIQYTTKPFSIIEQYPTAKSDILFKKNVSNIKQMRTHKSIEITNVITIAKANPNNNDQVVYRGIPNNTVTLKIVKQWQDVYSGVKQKETLFIDNQEEWEKLWRIHTINMNPSPLLPEVDFKENTVIAVFMGEKKSTGYGIHITRVDDTGTKLYVALEELIPGKGSAVAEKVTQPYHIVVVPRQ
jgi:hypothetical protein